MKLNYGIEIERKENVGIFSKKLRNVNKELAVGTHFKCGDFSHLSQTFCTCFSPFLDIVKM